MAKLVQGVGINDANYCVRTKINGNRVMCPFYSTWADMLKRCYSAKAQKRQPTYVECSVHPDWLTFSRFKSWMERQQWRGNQLDKDIIKAGNKVYSADTCAFVDQMTNIFVHERGAARGLLPLGVSLHKQNKTFIAECNNPFSNRGKYVGSFDCPNKAHLAWKKRKHELALQLADLQTDERVAQALRTRYA